jgi:pilus assembly protein CpaF
VRVRIISQRDGGAEAEHAIIFDSAISIGRGAQCGIRLESDLVSRSHAVFRPGTQGFVVEDTSTNGTLAGDVLLKRQEIEVPFGTAVKVGDFSLTLVQDVRRSAAPQAQRPAPRQSQLDHTDARPTMSPHANPAGSRGELPTFDGVPAHLASSHLDQTGIAGKQPMGMRALPQQFAQQQPLQQLPPPQRTRAPEIKAAVGRNQAVSQAEIDLRREIHKRLLEHLDLATLDPKKVDDPSMRPKVLTALGNIVNSLEARLPPATNRATLIGELADEALRLGPLERLLADPNVTEIMVVDPQTIYVEEKGVLTLSSARFTDDERVRAVIERIVTPLGRRIDESSPLVDARLKDGSRVNALIRPIALKGSCITIRKFAKTPLTLDKIVSFGTMTAAMGQFLQRSVIAKKNIIISGGTGSGKTTLLNVLSGSIPEHERIVTIEDAAELQLRQPHVVSLETRPPNLEGRGEYTIRDLVKNALRMRPDRIVVGECRGGEALDMLQAMNTGHDGSLTTTHANSPDEAIRRLETLVLMSGIELPVRAIREQIASSVHVIVQQSRLSDGTRKVTHISECTGVDRDSGEVTCRPIFAFVRTGTGENNEVLGEFRATGYLPSFLNDFIVMGLIKKGERYLG